MIFNGISKSYLRVHYDLILPAWAPIKRNILVVPGMPGGYLESSEVEPLFLNVPVTIEKGSFEDIERMKEDLASWLITDEPKELIFENDPNRVRFAVVDGSFDAEKLVYKEKAIITFVFPDPYKYGPEKEAIFPSDAVSLDYEGTAPGDPIFELEVLQPVTFSMIQNQNDEYMMIGKPDTVEEEPEAKDVIVLEDQLRTTVGWTTGTVSDYGVIIGTMSTDGESFVATDVGTGSGWHGPALKKSLSEPLEEFTIEFHFLFSANDTKQTGRIELYGLDETGEVIGKMSMFDYWVSITNALVQNRFGTLQSGQYVYNGTGKKDFYWKNFNGLMKLTRKNTPAGHKWETYIAAINQETGKHIRVVKDSRIDPNSTTGNLAQIQINIAAYGNTSLYNLIKANLVRVYKHNNVSSESIYIAQPGDVISFDHKNKDLLINGESRKDLKDFGARYFYLEKGENTLIVYPSDSFNVKCKYRERFK